MKVVWSLLEENKTTKHYIEYINYLDNEKPIIKIVQYSWYTDKDFLFFYVTTFKGTGADDS